MSSIRQRSRNSRNVYDFRSSAWYVSAATSPKDIVILIDSSGSMAGKKSVLMQSTVEAILDTLSDNDYVNVFRFSDVTEETVPCFRDMLVQVSRRNATPGQFNLLPDLQANNENKLWLKESLNNLRAENIANFTSALVTGFEILHKVNTISYLC